MRGRTILAWGIVAIDRAYLIKSHSLSQNRLFTTAAGKSSASLRMSVRTETSAQYRTFLEKEIREKKMTLASDEAALNRMISDFYIPVYSYIKKQLDGHIAKFNDDDRPPLFIGISAPQVEK